MPELAGLVAEQLGGRMEEHNPFRYQVTGTGLGDFTVELDLRLLADGTLRSEVRKWGLGEEMEDLTRRVEETLGKLALTVVPLEVVTPPIPLDRFQELEALREALRKGGAEGTEASIAYAFGLHLNPEAPDLDGDTLFRHLLAFLLLAEWLAERDEVDLTRRLVPFIQPFPKEYVQQVVEPGYAPDRERLMDDYLSANPTRNRPLDLLPLFAEIDPERVKAAVRDPLVSPRPAFHYRLPSCRIDDPRWSLAVAWNGWVAVEEVAADGRLLAEMRRAYAEHLSSPFRIGGRPWVERVAEWVAAVEGREAQ